MKVLLVGVCKNIENTIEIVRRGFEKLASKIDCKGIFYENNSTDRTAYLLKEWAIEDSRVICITEVISNEELLRNGFARTWDNLPCRMEVIAMARNKLMIQIEREEYTDIDYVIMIDMDNPIILPVDSIINTLESHKDFDALICKGGNSGDIYDTYAFRDGRHPFGPEYIGETFWNHGYQDSIKRSIQGKNDLVPVYSAFNGMAIFKRTSIIGIRYSAIPTKALDNLYRTYKNEYPQQIETHIEGRLQGVYLFGKYGIWYRNNCGYNFPVVCEHVTFFLEMRERGFNKIYICPQLEWLW